MMQDWKFMNNVYVKFYKNRLREYLGLSLINLFLLKNTYQQVRWLNFYLKNMYSFRIRYLQNVMFVRMCVCLKSSIYTHFVGQL